MNKVCLGSYLLFYCLLSAFNGSFYNENSERSRRIASKGNCQELIEPFLLSIKYAENYDEIFMKGYLRLEDVSDIKASSMFKALIEKNSTAGEDRDFAYAVLAFIKKKYPRLNDEAISTHYEAILRFCI